MRAGRRAVAGRAVRARGRGRTVYSAGPAATQKELIACAQGNTQSLGELYARARGRTVYSAGPAATQQGLMACAQGNAQSLDELYARAGAGAEFTVQGLQCALQACGSMSSNAAIFYTLTFRCGARAAPAALG